MKKSFRVLIIALVLGLGFIFTVGYTATLFGKSAKVSLSREAELQVVRFETLLNSEIKLALQMAKSPVVVSYMENPDDPDTYEAGVAEMSQYEKSFISKGSFWVSDSDLKFFSDSEYAYTVDPTLPENYWYNMTMRDKADYNFNINYNPNLQETNLWINAVVRNASGLPVGIVGTGIPISDFINEIFASIKSAETITYKAYMFNKNGETTACDEQKYVEEKKPIKDIIVTLGDKAVYSDEVRFAANPLAEMILAPIPSLEWTLLLVAPFDLNAFTTYCARPFAIFIVIVFALCLFQIIKQMMTPLKELNKTLDQMKSGNVDLSQRITVKTSSGLKTIKSLVSGFNGFIEKIQNTVNILKEAELQLELSRVQLNTGTSETITSINEISKDIDSFGESIKQQSSSAQETASAMNQISANIASLDSMISTQASAVDDASTAVEEMLGNIGSVNTSVGKLSASFDALEQETYSGVQKHSTMNDKIAQIQNESAMLAEANLVISSIAEQTNLLAMNAAIEAAHAGEAGKGFSVVADEIRKLSENSSEQSQMISQKLTDIQNSIADVVHASEEAGAAFLSVSSKIKETNTLVTEIANAMREQETGSQQINYSLRTLNDSSAEVRTASREMSAGSETIMGEVQILQEATLNIESGMSSLDYKSSGLMQRQSELENLSQEVNKAIEQLRTSLDMFKI